ncbi:MAG: hypothetical protein M3Z28_02160 [Candidatus Dormibacteraeota bacterium]|nr:hypothetical protein [Candidatus Dormibacteraeota bacterium]
MFKFAIPERASASIASVLPGIRERTLSMPVRLFAAVELAIALGLVTGWPQGIPLRLLALVGILFFGLGVFGWMRKSPVACGCLSIDETQPLGPVNCAVGIAFVALSVIFGQISPWSQTRMFAIDASISTVTVALAVNRRAIARYLNFGLFRSS